jgi:two-component system, sensor histidine kinase
MLPAQESSPSGTNGELTLLLGIAIASVCGFLLGLALTWKRRTAPPLGANWPSAPPPAIPAREIDGNAAAVSTRLRVAIDAAPVAIIAATLDGKVTLWNRGAQRIFGWRRDEVEGRALPFPPGDEAHEAALRQRLVAGNEIRDQATQRTDRDGEMRDIIISAVPERDAGGTVTGYVSVMEDVTDRWRNAAVQGEERARHRAVLDVIPDAIVTLDLAGAISGLNRAAETTFGYGAAEIVGRDLSTLTDTGPSPGPGSSDVSMRRKDGSTFAAELTLIDGEGVRVGIVRPRKSGAGEAKFLSLISHDLRQPIQALSLVTGALERRAGDPAMRELVEHLAAVVRSTQSTFESIVEWSKLEGGQIAGIPVPFEVGNVMASLAELFADEAERRGLALSWVRSSAEVRSDPAILRRVLHHLLDNAMKFTPAGKVLLGARRHGRNLRIMVADSGVGIPPNQRAAVLAPFSQLDAGREAGGLGLGLASAQRLAALVGATVDYRSTPGKGSVFWIEVPLAQTPRAA